MSILIKGMEMPEDCEHCELSKTDSAGFFGCSITENIVLRKREENRPSWCPLIEVPTPHGRLIDADKLYEVISLNYKDLDSTEDFMGIGYDHCIGDTLIVIRQASTIIEAEEG